LAVSVRTQSATLSGDLCRSRSYKDSYYLGLPQAAHVAKLRHNATAAFFGHMVR